MFGRRPIVSLVPVAALAFWPASDARAQVIQGVVVDEVSERPIQEAVVELVTADERVLSQDVTDINGWFSLKVPDDEMYQLHVGGLGYIPTFSTAFSLQPGQTVGAQLRMQVSPVQVSGIEAVVEGGGIEGGLERVGFYERQTRGFGQVRTPEDFGANPPLDLVDVFRGMNGIKLVQQSALADFDILSARRVFGDACRPSISIDHVLVQRGKRFSRLGVSAGDLERSVGGGREVQRSFWQDLVSPHEVAAIEVYAGQGGLPYWVSGDVSPCGAVLIWSKGYIETN